MSRQLQIHHQRMQQQELKDSVIEITEIQEFSVSTVAVSPPPSPHGHAAAQQPPPRRHHKTGTKRFKKTIHMNPEDRRPSPSSKSHSTPGSLIRIGEDASSFGIANRLSGIAITSSAWWKAWAVVVGATTLICLVMCTISSVTMTRSFRNNFFAFVLVSLHACVAVTWVSSRRTIRGDEWRELLDSMTRPPDLVGDGPAYKDEIHSSHKFTDRLRLLSRIFWIGSVAIMAFIYMGWAVPVNLSIGYPSNGERGIAAQIINYIHGISLDLLIIPWVWAFLGDAFVFHIVTFCIFIRIQRLSAKVDVMFRHGCVQDEINGHRHSNLSRKGGAASPDQAPAEESDSEVEAQGMNYSMVPIQSICLEMQKEHDFIQFFSRRFSPHFVMWQIQSVLMMIAGCRNLVEELSFRGGPQDGASVWRWADSVTDGSRNDLLFHVFQDLFYSLGGLAFQFMILYSYSVGTSHWEELRYSICTLPNRIKNVSALDRTAHSTTLIPGVNEIQGGLYCYGFAITPTIAIGIGVVSILLVLQLGGIAPLTRI